MNDLHHQHILLFTAKGTGHNLIYLKILLDALLIKKYKITIALPKSCLKSESFKYHIQRFTNKIEIVLHTGSNTTNSFINSWHECIRLKDTISLMKETPSVVLAPNGSQIPFLWPLFRSIYSRQLKQVEKFQFGMLSTGIDFSARTFKSKIVNKLRVMLLSLNPPSSLKTIDAYGFQLLESKFTSLKRIFSLVPDPMDTVELVDKKQARNYFNLPEKSFIISISGALSSHPRKNTKLLIDATLSTQTNKNIVLFIAGKLTDELNCYIKDNSAKTYGRIITVNRYLSDEELTIATCASDVVCTPYSDHFAPSGIILRAIKCNVPVLVPKYHWFNFMIKNFNVGWTIPSLNQKDLTNSIEKVFNELSNNHKLPTANYILKNYFSEKNFSAHWLECIDGDSHDIFSFDKLKLEYKQQIEAQLQIE